MDPNLKPPEVINPDGKPPASAPVIGQDVGKQKSFNKRRAIIFIAIFAAAGVYFLLVTFANSSHK